MVHNQCDGCGREYSQRRGKYQFAPTCSRRCDKLAEEDGEDDAFVRLSRSHPKGMSCLSYGRRAASPICADAFSLALGILGKARNDDRRR